MPRSPAWPRRRAESLSISRSIPRRRPAVGRPPLALVFGVLMTLGLYASVLVHEFGHALTARIYDVPTDRVTLLVPRRRRIFRAAPASRAEAVVAIAGPLTSYAIAFGLWFIAIATGHDFYLWQLVVPRWRSSTSSWRRLTFYPRSHWTVDASCARCWPWPCHT